MSLFDENDNQLFDENQSPVGAEYQCIKDSCSLLQTNRPSRYRRECTEQQGSWQQCCPAQLKENNSELPVYIKNTGNKYTSCFHDLVSPSTRAAILAITGNPKYDYKDPNISYQVQVQRYRDSMAQLQQIWRNSELAGKCQSGEEMSKCLARICTSSGYQLAENDYQVCMASGDTANPTDRKECAISCPKKYAKANSSTITSPTSPTIPTTSTSLVAVPATVSLDSRHIPPTHSYWDSLILPLFDPGRGGYAGFSVVGHLQLPNYPSRKLPLYGRRIAPHAYQYHTIDRINPQLRMPVQNPDYRELQPNQLVTVEGLQHQFQIILYKPDYESFAPY